MHMSLQVGLHVNCKIFVEGTLRKGNCSNIATCRDVSLYIFMMYFAHFVWKPTANVSR